MWQRMSMKSRRLYKHNKRLEGQFDGHTDDTNEYQRLMSIMNDDVKE